VINVLEILALLAGACVFVGCLHQWSESGDRHEPLVPWLDRDEEFWCEDDEESES
jgi:hypothetical protein